MTDELKLETDGPCLKCGKDALDTGWECTECGFDNRPWYYPEGAKRDELGKTAPSSTSSGSQNGP